MVIGTDYENYTSVYACEEDLGGIITYGWLMTRDLYPSPDVVGSLVIHMARHT